jgi:uncharacterized membrane protein
MEKPGTVPGTFRPAAISRRTEVQTENEETTPKRFGDMRPLTKAGLVLGLGMGGFIDGIVLHQILGWHHLICTTETCAVDSVQALERQNTQDGFFHLATWILCAVGIALLFRAARVVGQNWSGRVLTGAMLAGWGVFNLVEGLIDHQLLGIHHVRPGHELQFVFDMLFLASGVVLIGIGASLVRNGRRETSDTFPAAMGNAR